MDPGGLERALTPRTKAVIPVHLNGRVCDMDKIMEFARRHKLAVVEDACQALGATFRGKMAGSFGTGCFSFYPFKALGALGDAGAITTDDPEVARIARLLRYNGEDRETGDFYFHGYTALLDNLQASVLDAKLRHFPSWVEHRRHMGELYQKALSEIPRVILPHFPGDSYRDSYQNYVIRAQRRDELRSFLKEQGVETLISWPKPMWEHPGLKLPNPNLKFTERVCREVLSLPLSAETTGEHVEITAAAIREFYAKG
jgi:dTDP-4-amino-4,6-dideoxygalactose transaminase